MPNHPLDDCDPSDCYQTMMSERNELVKARREAEDNLVKTIIQLSSGLVVLMAGFAVQSEVVLEGFLYALFVGAIILLAIAITAGLTEHYYSSKAYLSQQNLVEQYFTKQISSFSEPNENARVRMAQLAAFGSFLAALTLLGVIAIVKAGVSDVESAATAATTTSSSSSASGTAAPTVAPGQLWRQQGRSSEISRAVNAASTSTEKEVAIREPGQ